MIKKIIKRKKTKKYKKIKDKNIKGGSKYSLQFIYKKKEIKIIGLNHFEKGISDDEINKIVDYANTKRNICYLIELDTRFTQGQIKLLKSHGDYTTRIIIPKLKKIYKETYKNICIKGWDTRAGIFGQDFQNKLYNNPNKLTLNEIFNSIQLILRFNKNYYLKNKIKYTNEQKKYIEFEYKKLQDDRIFFFKIDEKSKKKIGKGYFHKIVDLFVKDQKLSWDIVKNFRLNEIKGINKDLTNLIISLRNIILEISDLYIIQKIILAEKNYIIFVGKTHFDNIKIHLKKLKII